MPALWPRRMLPAPWSPVLQKCSVLAAQDGPGPRCSAAGLRGHLTARRAREPVRDHPGAKAGPGTLGGEEWVGLGVGGQGTQTVQAKRSQEGQDGARGGGATHTYPRLPETLLVSPRAPDPLCTHRLRLCGDFLATGPGKQENGPPGGAPPYLLEPQHVFHRHPHKTSCWLRLLAEARLPHLSSTTMRRASPDRGPPAGTGRQVRKPRLGVQQPGVGDTHGYVPLLQGPLFLLPPPAPPFSSSPGISMGLCSPS